jgi:hypothetical protein
MLRLLESSHAIDCLLIDKYSMRLKKVEAGNLLGTGTGMGSENKIDSAS